jgi:hypothetical protein
MKQLVLLCFFPLMFASCNNANKQGDHQHGNDEKVSNAPSSSQSLSPHKETMALIGDAHIHIDYSAPSVRGRIVFGGLLAYGEVWQSGAHNATWIETNKDLVINNQLLQAGKYGFFTIPNKENWTVIFNSNWNQHGKDEYDMNDDVLRFEVTPEISDELTEQLNYSVTQIDDENGIIQLSWEKASISFSFAVSE